MKRLFAILLAVVVVSASAAPKLVGHRGSIWGVENTREAFINGVKKGGYDCLETDIKVTLDGKFICWHNDVIEAGQFGFTKECTINAHSLKWLQTQTLIQTRDGVTYTGTFCSFEEYLDICKEYNVTPVIELKWADGINSNDQSNIPALMQIVIDKGFRNNCYIFTSMKNCLTYVKENYPDVEIMLLVYDTSFDDSLSWCKTNDCHIGTETGTGVTKAGVQAYHDAGLLVNAWTIDDEGDYVTYANFGCDFITTNKLEKLGLPQLGASDPVEDVTFETLWEKSTTLGNAPSNIDGNDARQGSAHNGIFYVNNREEKKLHLFGSEAQYLGSIPGGGGYGCDCDDAGNVVIRNDANTTASHSFLIYPAGATVVNPGIAISVDVTLPLAGQTDFISASGNILGSEGGCIYMYPNGQTAVCVISMVNGEVKEIKSYTGLSLTGTAAGYVIPMENNPQKWIYQVRTSGYYTYNTGTNTALKAGSSSTTQPARNSTVGGEYFKLGGEEYFIHNSGANFQGGFTVRKRSTDEVVTSVEPIGTLAYEYNKSVANWVRAEAIDDYSCYIYQYCPANGMAVYKISVPNPYGDGNADGQANEYIIEVKSEKFSKHSRETNPLYGVTYTEDNASYSNENWPLVEGAHDFKQGNYSQTLATSKIVRQFGVSMGVVYWIDPAENYIYWWNTVTGESGKTAPSKSYGIGYADGIDNPNFDFTFLGSETGSGSISHDWYGNLVHMWNEGLDGWGTTAGTHFVKGYAVYKAPTEYGQLMDFIPKLSRLDDTGRENYPFFQRIVEDDGNGNESLKGTSNNDFSNENYTYYPSSKGKSNPNYPADEIDWGKESDYHKANVDTKKQPTDFLGVSGNLWGAGLLQGSTNFSNSVYSLGIATGYVFHARNNIAYGNMFADGQYTNWYLNYSLTAGNRTNLNYFPGVGLWKDTDPSESNHFLPCNDAFDNAPTEYIFKETDRLEYFWGVPNAGLGEFNVYDRSSYEWNGYVDNLNHSGYNGATVDKRHQSDVSLSADIDSIKGTRILVHNYWVADEASDITNATEQQRRNGSIMIQYSKYDGDAPTATMPIFTGNLNREYEPVGNTYGYANADKIPTANSPIQFNNTEVNSWNELERVNDNVFALYTHVPGRGFSKTFITAVRPNNPVSNLKVAKQYMNANNQIVNVLTWVPQQYDRATMHTYEVWYRRKRSGESTYKDYKTIDGESRAVWNFAGKASVKYNGDTDSTVTHTYSYANNSGNIVYKTITIPKTTTYYNSYTAESCTFEHVAPHDTEGNKHYDMEYEYMVIPLYDRSAHRGTESNVIISTTEAPICPVNGALKQVTDINDNEQTLYGFSVQLDPNVNVSNTGAKTANTMIIVPQDEYTEAALANRTSVTGPEGVIITESKDAATYYIYGTNYLTVDGYHVIVTDFEVGDEGALPSLIWHNIDPTKEYNVKVYIMATSGTYFTPSDELTTTLIVPELTWSTTPADFYKLKGDYGKLTGNEDMPIGSFRRIDPNTNKLDETPTNPVSLNNANYYGTNESVLNPVYVTDEVMGTLKNGAYSDAGWAVSFEIAINDDKDNLFYKEQFENQLTSAAYYSNEKGVMCDVVGLKADYEEKLGEDTRTRKVYTPTKKTYEATVKVAYQRLSDGLIVEKTTNANLELGSTLLPALGVNASTQSVVTGALYQRSGSHFYYDNATNNGYYPYYYDAAMLFNWDEYNSLNRYMGYYGASKAICHGHYENNGPDPDKWVQYHAGSVLTDNEVNGLNRSNPALTYGAIGYTGSNNWSAQAIENNQVPMLVHYVYGANAPLASTETSVSKIKFDVTLTAEYPVINYADKNAGILVAKDPATYSISNGEMNVMTVPTSFTNMYVNNTFVTTGVEDVLSNAVGEVKLYPNPVESVFTLQAPTEIGEVQIFSMDGQLVKEESDINDTIAKINVDELPNGIYYIKVLGETKIVIKR